VRKQDTVLYQLLQQVPWQPFAELSAEPAHAYRDRGFTANRVSASLQLGWRMAILSVVDDGVVSGRSDGDCLASKPMEEQASCF